MHTAFLPGALKWLRALVALFGLLTLFVVWLPISFRPFSSLLGVLIVGAWGLSRLRGRMTMWVVIWCAVSMSPLELSLKNAPGPPRVVPFVFGTPSARGRELIALGEIASGGCMYSPFGPKWVIIW